MANPLLQTILTITKGNADEEVKAFLWGKRVEPVAVGSRGQWVVRAPGVLAVHLYLAFDGRLVHVTAAGDGAKVFLGKDEVDQTWWTVPVGSELRFGDAVISIKCEEVPIDDEVTLAKAPSVAPPPVAPQGGARRPSSIPLPRAVPAEPNPLDLMGQTMVVRGSAPPAAEPQRSSAPPDARRSSAPPADAKRTSAPPAVEAIRPVQVEARRSDPPAGQAMVPVRAVPIVLGSGQPAPAAKVPEPAGAHSPSSPPAGASPNAGANAPYAPPNTGANAPYAPPNAAGANAPNAGANAPYAPPNAAGANAPHAYPNAPSPQPMPPHGAQGASGPTMLGHGHSPAGFGQGLPPAAPPPPGAYAAGSAERAPNEPALPTFQVEWPTLFDGGALRDHAKKLQTLSPEATQSAQEAYAAEVRARTGRNTGAPPPNAEQTPPPVAPVQNVADVRAWSPPASPARNPQFGDVAPLSPEGAKPGQPLPAPPPDEPEKKKPFAKAIQSWKEASAVKKISLALLPFAAFAALWEPPAPEEPPPQVVSQPAPGPSGGEHPANAETHTAEAPASGAAAAQSVAAVPAAPASGAAPETAPSTSAEAPGASAVAAPAGSVVAPASAEPATSAEPPGAVAALANSASPRKDSTPTPSAKAADDSKASPAPSGSADSAEAEAERAANLLEQRALSAALEGRLQEAATFYMKVAEARQNSQIYVLAARLARDGAVRKP